MATEPVSIAELGDDEVVVNATLAAELEIDVGDQITVRLPAASAVPADSPLGRRDMGGEGLPRMTVVAVIDSGLANFSLMPDPQPPRNAMLSRRVIGEALDRPGQANALLLTAAADADVAVSLADLGLKVESASMEFDGHSVYRYASLTSDQLLIPPAIVDAVGEAGLNHHGSPTLTYLANAIIRDGDGGREVPYSIVTATDSTDDLPLRFDAVDPPPGVVPVVINDWTAERLGAAAGDRLTVFYFEPEVTDGEEIERSFAAIVADVVPLTEPSRGYRRNRPPRFDSPPTRYNDPFLTPTVPGVTDTDSINDWDLPFPLTRTVAREDDDYYKHHRLTPKLFLPLAAGRRLFGGRFGDVTSIRFPGVASEELAAQLNAAMSGRASDLGWAAMPVAERQRAASSGTTPLDGLFLALSMFVIAAALGLIAMLTRLALVVRSRQIGTLAAVGWPTGRIGRVLMAEILIAAAVGAAVGCIAGVGYAGWLVAGLRKRLVSAAFFELHVSPTSLGIGAAAAVGLAMGIAWWSVRGILKTPAAGLLAGRVDGGGSTAVDPRMRGAWYRRVGPAFFLAALGLMTGAATTGGMVAAGLFVGAGMMLLAALIWWLHRWLSAAGGQTNVAPVHSMVGMIGRSAARSPGRSVLAIGLMAVAAFLVVAMSAFQARPTDEGTGGFDFIAISSSPVYRDLADPAVRSELMGGVAESLAGTVIEPMRMRGGQDASCNNLYRAVSPTVLGVRPSIVPSTASKDFRWTAHEPVPDSRSPWTVLTTPGEGTTPSPVPVVIDQNTAMWSLGLTGGVGEVARFTFGEREVVMRVAGLLAGSTLQGKLMVGEDNFLRVFPEVSGYQFFLVRTPSSPPAAVDVQSAMESRLSDVGMDVVDSDRVLADLLAVQNTYLATFQSLGALGLLLGTIGLAVAQVRGVWTRRGELAVMRSVGFSRGRLATLVMGETVWLLVLGIGTGLACALLAVAPVARGRGLDVAGPVISVGWAIAVGTLAAIVATAVAIRLPLIESLRSE